jgi:hypothetical protein
VYVRNFLSLKHHLLAKGTSTAKGEQGRNGISVSHCGPRKKATIGVEYLVR